MSFIACGRRFVVNMYSINDNYYYRVETTQRTTMVCGICHWPWLLIDRACVAKENVLRFDDTAGMRDCS